MAIKEYDSENPVNMAKEPIVAYVSSSGKQAPPCQYTEEEVVQRVLQATADVDAGRNLMTHEEFKKQVHSWKTKPVLSSWYGIADKTHKP